MKFVTKIEEARAISFALQRFNFSIFIRDKNAVNPYKNINYGMLYTRIVQNIACMPVWYILGKGNCKTQIQTESSLAESLGHTLPCPTPSHKSFY